MAENHRAQGGKERCASKYFSRTFFFHRVSVSHDARSEATARKSSTYEANCVCVRMKYGYFTGVGTNERSDMYPYFSLWIVDVFIGHHLLCPSPYSLSWWVRRGVQGEGAGSDVIGRLFWPTQVKWNDCYCTRHNSWGVRRGWRFNTNSGWVCADKLEKFVAATYRF